MKLYLISQDENIKLDTYDSAVVAAPDEDTARHMNPDPYYEGAPYLFTPENWQWGDWASSPDNVIVTYLGEYVKDEQGVICSSLNAG